MNELKMKGRFLLFSLVLSICFMTQHAFSQQSFTIKGLVVHAGSQEPVSNANIVLPGTPNGTSSDQRGRFELQLIGGEYRIRITSLGFAGKVITLRVPEQSSRLLKVELVPRELEIEGVDVFGHYFIPGRDTSLDRIPVSILPAVTTISAVEIEKQGAATLLDALKFVPGGWTESRGRKTKQFFSVRGQKYPYPDYSINGVWQKEFEETGYFLSALDIESIEIVRSSSALVKGLSGLTGVIDVKTKKPERETLSFLAKYGEQNNYLTSMQYGNKVNAVAFNTSFSLFGTDGPAGRNGKERIGNFHGNVDWKVNQNLQLTAGASYIRGLRQLVRIDDETGAPKFKNRRERYDPVRTLLTYMKMEYTGNDGSRTEWQTNMTNRNVDFALYNVSEETTTWHDESDHELGINVLHSRPLSETNTLRIGGLYNHWVAPNGKRYYVGRRCNVHTFSGVIASEQKAGKFLFDGGLRLIGGHIVEWGGFGIEGSPSGFQQVDPIKDEPAPVEWQSVLGASYVLSGTASLHCNFSGGTIAPRQGSLNDEGETPGKEGRFQYDLGFRYKTPNRSEVTVSPFYSRRNNSIGFSGQTLVTGNDLVMELYENIDKRTYGIEMSAKMNVPSLNSYVFGNALFMKGEKEEDGEMTEDEKLPGIILNTGVYFDYSGFDANLFVNYTGPYANNRFANPAWVRENGDVPLGDFVAADLTAGYTFPGRMNTRLFVEVKNVLDENYMTVAGFPDPGRLFMAGMKIVLL